ARRHRPGRSRPRGPGVGRRFTRRRTHSHGRIQREGSPAFRRGARGAGAADGPERLRHQAGRAFRMSKETVTAPQLEWLLAGLLCDGTWLASWVTGLGLALSLPGGEGARVVAAGVALFIALPVLRVLVILGAFILNQDYRLVIAATAVLMTIVAGLV